MELDKTLDTVGRREIREPRVEEALGAGSDRPIARIVDPLAEDEDDDSQGDLYMESRPRPEPVITASSRGYSRPLESRAPDPRASEVRRPTTAPLEEPPASIGDDRKTGWRSLFGGRPRAEAAPSAIAKPTPQMRTAWQAETEPQKADDDLEIPSFLRRLAN
jgi:cell division protein FtsZ